MKTIWNDKKQDMVEQLDTNLNLQQVYLASPWADAIYVLLNEDYILLAEYDNKSIHPIAMMQGNHFKLVNAMTENYKTRYEFVRIGGADE